MRRPESRNGTGVYLGGLPPMPSEQPVNLGEGTMSDNDITPFLFEGEGLVRVVTRNGEPWFVAADVCRILGIRDTSDAVSRLEDDEKGTGKTGTPGGEQEVLIVSESGLYALIFRSRKPNSVKFRRWVTGEVLPSIRKTGSYGKAKPAEQEVIQPDKRPFPDWPMEELRTKQATVHMYRQTYGVLSAQWVAPQVGFPVPPRHLIEIGKQLDMFAPRDGSDSNVFPFPGAE